MTIPPIAPIAPSFSPLVAPVVPTGAAEAVGTAASGSGADFGAALAHGLDHLQGLQNTSDNLATQAATGDLKDVHDYMIASTEASLGTELTVAFRNKAVEAFNEIMRMPV